jgi:hypothetical protein
MPKKKFRKSSIQDTASLLKQLEKHCHERNRSELKEGIRFLFREFPSTPRLLHRAFDWYWRSGLQKEALQLAYAELDLGEKLKSPLAFGNTTGLWFMLLLASQSGTLWVEKWLKVLPKPKTSRDLILLGRVLSLIQNYDPAIGVFETELEKVSASTRERRNDPYMMLTHLYARLPSPTQKGLAYAHEWKAVLKDSDPFLKWQADLLVPFFEARLGNPEKHLEEFVRTQALQPNADFKAPRILRQILIWRAEIEFLCGKKDDARVSLNHAETLTLSLPEYSPLRVTDLYCERYRFGISTPEEQEVLAQYPDLPLAQSLIAKELRDSVLREESPPSSDWEISLSSDEFRIKKEWFYGIPLEIRLLAHLKAAGKLGIHRNHLLALLWPDQWMLLPQLDERLNKLIKRLRVTHKFTIQAERECLILDSEQREFVSLTNSRQKPFLLENLLRREDSSFVWELVGKTYSLGPTQSREVLRKWLEKGWITREGGGRTTRYRAV